ncbi:MAG: efflux transporter outer membrane subunit [Rubrivivax sp.]|nr:efflux transporter outer membrane subunit [Rubrivivax sp.]
MTAPPSTASPPRRPRGKPGLALAVALTGLALAGCASHQRPGPVATVELPAAWSSAPPGPRATGASGAGLPQAAPTPLQWWQQLGDATLADFVARAVSANADVATAQARLSAARAQRDLAAAALAPTLGARASTQATRTDDRPASARSATAALDAGWEPDLAGVARAGVDAAEAERRAAAATLGATQVRIAAEVALAYVDLRNAQARLAIARRTLDAQQQQLQITRWRAEAGLVTVLDVEQARTAVEQLRAALPALEAAIRLNGQAIAVLAGEPPGALPPALADAAPLPAVPERMALAFPADVLRQRPDVRAAERGIEAAQARIEQADRQRWPSLNLTGSLGVAALTLSGLGAAPVAGSLAAAVGVPVFDGGRIAAQVRLQEAALDQARAAWRTTVLAALQETEAALIAIDRAARQREAQAAALDAARNAARLAEFQYQSGLVDILTVLSTQRTQLNLEDALAGTEAELVAQHVRLYKASGGGWSGDDDTAGGVALGSADAALQPVAGDATGRPTN